MRKHYLEKTKPRRQIISLRLAISKNIARILAGKDVRPLERAHKKAPMKRVYEFGSIILEE